MDKYYIIVNPISGHGAGERAIPAIERLLAGLGLEYDLVRTTRPWHAAELAQQATGGGYAAVVAVGGDGTANEVLNGLLLPSAERMDGLPSMGVLSVGRGNDFAFGNGIPADLEAGCRALAEDHRRTIDVGRVVGGFYPQGRYFGNGVGIGFDALVGFEAAKMKRWPGFAGYTAAALKVMLFHYDAPMLRIELDGEVITQPALMVSIMNGRRMGGGFMMAPQGRSDDDRLELCIAGRVSRAGILGLIPRFMQGTQGTHGAIQMPGARRVVVTALEGSLAAHADGETLCTAGERLAVEVLPRRLALICDRQVAEP